MTALKDLWRQQRQQRQQELTQRRQQVHESLEAFHQTRQLKASQLRDDLNLFQLELQSETQALLVNYQQQRVRMQKSQARELTAFVATLQMQVQDYIGELALARQARADQLRFLPQDCERRRLEVKLLFQQLSEFRLGLRQYRSNLSEFVWGGTTLETWMPEAPEHASSDSIAPQGESPQPKAFDRALPIAIAAPAAPVASTTEMPTEILERVFPEAIAELDQESKSLEAALPNSNHQEARSLEAAIYNHIHQVQGARLHEIEVALGMNRFQTIDALRSLIRDGFVTQRDRVYFVQEEMM